MTDFTFSWEGSDNPNDPSGIAKFTVGLETVSIIMDSLQQASSLRRLFEKACYREKQQIIDRIHCHITQVLNESRND